MKKSFLDNILKVNIIFSILVVSLSVSYYFVFFLPKQEEVNRIEEQEEKKSQEAEVIQKKEEEETRLIKEKEEKCFSEGKKFHETYKESKSRISDQIMNPTYHYNKTLDKCLYDGGHLSKKFNSDEFIPWIEIVDIYTNKTLLSISPLVEEKEELEKKYELREKLMNN